MIYYVDIYTKPYCFGDITPGHKTWAIYNYFYRLCVSLYYYVLFLSLDLRKVSKMAHDASARFEV
jgi:hypothetical protein